MTKKQTKPSKTITARDPEHTIISKRSIDPGKLTIDDIKGSVIRLADSEVFWKIPNSDIILSRFSNQEASILVAANLVHAEYAALLDGLRYGKLVLTDETTVTTREPAAMMLMNPDQWTIGAFRLLDMASTADLRESLAVEDNLLTLERALELESGDRKRDAVISLLAERISAVKKA